jgi:hypothetical protein
MSNVTTTIDTYLSAWNETDPERRAKLIESAWADDGCLIDPPLTGEGHAGINDMSIAFHTHYAGHQFRRASAIDEHHGYLRFAWELVGPDGTVALTGLDVGELAEDGRLRRITGFFGELSVEQNA